MTDDTHRRLDDDLHSKAELLHELQVHQIELEMQNSQLREAQQELEEARDRYADLYDFSPVGYLTLDEKGVVQEINLTGASMLGVERLNIVGQPFINRLTSASIQPFTTHLRQTFSVPGNSVTEILIKAREEKPRLVSLESLAVNGDKRICRTVMLDVTEQRRIAIALQISRSAQDALLNAIPALVFYVDVNLRYLNCSQTFADFVGLSPEEVAGKTAYDLFPDDDADEIQQIFSSVLRTDMALYGFEHTLTDATGSVFYLSSVITPFRDFQDKTIGLVGVCLDITAIKNTSNSNSELLVQNRKLTHNLFKAQEEERRHIARELHDELGQWFTAIQTEAQIICNVAKYAPNIHDSALAISKSASAVHEVIRGMLHRLRPSMLDELGLADSLRELERQWCKSHPEIVCEINIEAALDGLGEELNITIYRLVQEALNNIARHAHAKRVLVSLQKEPARDKSNADILLLRVVDDGAGFDFQESHEGIGLLGMRERVISAGGEFNIESAPGSGTKVMARLPLANKRVERNG